MKARFEEFETLIYNKLNDTSLKLAIFDEMGNLNYQNFEAEASSEKNQLLGLVTNLIRSCTGMVEQIQTQFPEYLILKGSASFLLLMPSLQQKHYYMIFSQNGLMVGMVRLCLNDAILQFEAKYH